jgi:hypothetical protein
LFDVHRQSIPVTIINFLRFPILDSIFVLISSESTTNSSLDSREHDDDGHNGHNDSLSDSAIKLCHITKLGSISSNSSDSSELESGYSDIAKLFLAENPLTKDELLSPILLSFQ